MSDQKRLVVGVTGSFGSGKSSVGQILRGLGARQVIDCDRLVHEAFGRGHPLRRRIRSLFGSSGSLGRREIARNVFRDLPRLRQLEAILHPYVRRRIRSALKRWRRGVVVLEVPLLFETGFDRYCDVTVAVVAGRRNRFKRLRAAGFRPAEVRARERAQLSEQAKKRRADLFIRNRGTKQQLVQETKHLWAKLLSTLKGA